MWHRVAFVALLALAFEPALADRTHRPNVVLVLADDLGIGDIGPYGASRIKTPNLDRLAAEGAHLTQFYSSANVCTPSRAGLLTGRYPIRSGLAHNVIEPGDTHGLPERETTLAELLQARGYHTAVIGKWHLGHTPAHWPTRHGFDYFYGVPYSNDMAPLALYRGRDKIEAPVVQATLTERFVADAVRFIEHHRNRPFFVFLAHTAPHIPLVASERFAGRSAAGVYGDVVETIDWGIGEILATIARLGLDEDTLVIFTSDNGAWFEGSNATARDGKGGTWEGGYLAPLIARWPGRIPAGARSVGLSMNIDLLPTIAGLTGAELPAGLHLDGRDIWPLLTGSQTSPHELLLFFNNEDIAALRSPRWKLVVRGYYRTNYAAFDRFQHLELIEAPYFLLFDMLEPQPERYSLAREHPEVVAQMLNALTAARTQFDPLRTRDPAKVIP